MTIEDLIKRCKCGVYLTVNKHRDIYESLEAAIEEFQELTTVSSDAKERILSSGSIVELQFYPETPIGFFLIVDGTLEDALRRAEDALANDRPCQRAVEAEARVILARKDKRPE